MSQPVQLVVFDIAGTIVKDGGEITKAFRKALQAYGFDAPDEAVNALMGYEKSEAIRKLLPDEKRNEDALVQQIHERFREEMIKAYQQADDLQMLPGAVETFDALKSRNIRIGVNTGFSKNITESIVAKLAWAFEKVDAIISSDEVAQGRPHPDMIREIMRRTGIENPLQVIKVGDTEVDVREGQNAGCLYSIAVTTGAFSRVQLAPYNPSFIIDHLAELLTIINAENT